MGAPLDWALLGRRLDRFPTDADARDGDAVGMRLIVQHRLQARIVLVVVALAQARAFADGGTVQMRKEAGGVVITVFTSEAPLAVGPVDVSILLQDRDRRAPVLDADVLLLLRRPGSSTEIRARATREQAQNKLLYAAPVTLPESGKWQLIVAAQRPGSLTEITGEVQVTPKRTMAASHSSYLAFPPAMIAAFAIREWLIRRRSSLRVNRCATT
jgi:hypothetical protein